MLPYGHVVIVPHSPSVLCKPVPAGPGRPNHYPRIGGSPCTCRLVKVCHGVQHVVVPATDGLLDGPGFLCGTGFLAVDTTHTVFFATPLKAPVRPPPFPPPPVHRWQLGSHQHVRSRRYATIGALPMHSFTPGLLSDRSL